MFGGGDGDGDEDGVKVGESGTEISVARYARMNGRVFCLFFWFW